MSTTWDDYLYTETLFSNAIRLRYFIWIIQQYIPSGKKVLEIGFGSGTTSVLLADLGYFVTAMDINEILVSRLSDRYSDIVKREKLKVIKGDMFSLPWQEREHDLALHQGVLEHFSDAEILKALKEQSRAARWVIFDVPNHRHGVKNFGDERLLRPEHWRQLIKQAGLSLEAEFGRDFQRWLYIFPNALFARRVLVKWPWFSRLLGKNSIFVCRA